MQNQPMRRYNNDVKLAIEQRPESSYGSAWHFIPLFWISHNSLFFWVTSCNYDIFLKIAGSYHNSDVCFLGTLSLRLAIPTFFSQCVHMDEKHTFMVNITKKM